MTDETVCFKCNEIGHISVVCCKASRLRGSSNGKNTVAESESELISVEVEDVKYDDNSDKAVIGYGVETSDLGKPHGTKEAKRGQLVVH